MSKFDVEKLDVDGVTPFYKLIKNDKCLFDDYMDGLKKSGNRKSEIGSIFSIINNVSRYKVNECETPKKLFASLKGYYKVIDFEIRKNGIRVYVSLYLDGYLLFFGGEKQDQNRDIASMRAIKKEFLNL